MIGYTEFLHPFRGESLLFGGERQAGHFGACYMMQIDSKPTPARADIEHL